MILKDIAYFTSIVLSVLGFVISEFGTYITRYIELDKVTFETIFMPLMALGKFTFPFLICFLIISKIKKGSLFIGILCLVVGIVSVGMDFESFQTWKYFMYENIDDEPYLEHKSNHTQFFLTFVILDIGIICAGTYLIIRYCKKSAKITRA